MYNQHIQFDVEIRSLSSSIIELSDTLAVFFDLRENKNRKNKCVRLPKVHPHAPSRHITNHFSHQHRVLSTVNREICTHLHNYCTIKK